MWAQVIGPDQKQHQHGERSEDDRESFLRVFAHAARHSMSVFARFKHIAGSVTNGSARARRDVFRRGGKFAALIISSVQELP